MDRENRDVPVPMAMMGGQEGEPTPEGEPGNQDEQTDQDEEVP